MNKKLNPVISFILILFFGILIFSMIAGRGSGAIEKNEIDIEKKESKIIIDKNLTPLEQLYKYELKSNLDIEKYDINLEITNYLEGKTLDKSYRVNLFAKAEEDYPTLVRVFHPDYKVVLLDYHYIPPVEGFDSFSRCKIKKVGTTDDKSGWLNCGWITEFHKRKLTKKQRKNLFNLYRKSVDYPASSINNFDRWLRVSVKNYDEDSVESPSTDVYQTYNFKKIVGFIGSKGSIAGSNWKDHGFDLVDYYRPKKACKVIIHLENQKEKEGWLKCSNLKIGGWF